MVQPGLGSIEDTERWTQWDNKIPPLAAEGPQLPAVLGRDFEVEHRALYEAIILGILDIDTVSYEAFVRRIIQEQPISWTRCRQTLQEAQRQIQAGFLDVDTVHLNTCLDILRRLATTDAWPFLDQLQSRSPPTVPSMDEIDLQVAETQILPNRQAVPRPVGKERVFLHAFSGRRRPGDLQHYLEAAFARQAEGVVLHVVSMDMIIDRQWGDACRPETRDFWLRGALDGLSKAGFAAPLVKLGVKRGLWKQKLSKGDNPAPCAHWSGYGDFLPYLFEKWDKSRWATSCSCFPLIF